MNVNSKTKSKPNPPRVRDSHRPQNKTPSSQPSPVVVSATSNLPQKTSLQRRPGTALSRNPRPRRSRPPITQVPPNLGQLSGYWQTLTEPTAVHGVKIPDVTFEESGTFTTVQRVGFTQGGTTGTNCTGFFLGGMSYDMGGTISPLIPVNEGCQFGNSGSTTWVQGGTCGSAAVPASPFSDAATTAGVNPIAFANSAFLLNNTALVRIVSMSIEVTCGAAPLNQSGFYVCGSLPADTHNVNHTWTSETSDTLKSRYQSQIFPVGDGGVRMIYMPSDESCLLYSIPDAVITSVDYNPIARDPANFFVYVEGATAGATFIATITMNWEYIPTSNTLMVGIGPSEIDYASMEYALNNIQTVQLVTNESSDDVHACLTDAGNQGLTSILTDPSSGSIVAVHSAPLSRLTDEPSPGLLGNPRDRKKAIKPKNRITASKKKKKTKKYKQDKNLGKSILSRIGSTLWSMVKDLAPDLLDMLL